MLIREATVQDIPEIVELLKSSLGESLLPKSDTYWRWKHLENPFGVSPVLLAFEGNALVGVRAFMCWKWIMKGQVFSAVRAVDTATHPQHQGKGIFKKLTLRLLDECKVHGHHFVFNTPNNNSRPGYLKMGWEQAGKVPIHLSIVRPARFILNIAKITKPAVDVSVNNDTMSELLALRDIDKFIQRYKQMNETTLITDYSVPYLNWRYLDVPVVKYYAGIVGESSDIKGFFLYRVKTSKIGNELRITDLFALRPEDVSAFRKTIRQKAKEHRADYVTVTGKGNGKMFGFASINNLQAGPIVTIKNIKDMDLTLLQKFGSWQPSLGDLELF